MLPVKEKDRIYFFVFDVFDMFRHVFGIVDYLEDPCVHKTILLLFIFIICILFVPMLGKYSCCFIFVDFITCMVCENHLV